MPLLHTILKKSLQCEIKHGHFCNISDLHCIAFPDDENVLGCVVSLGNFCRLDTALYPVNKIQECNYSYFRIIRINW